MFVLIGQNLHGTVTDVNQIDKHFNPFAASHHIVTKRPERFLFIVACFNIPNADIGIMFHRNEYKNSGIYFILSLPVWFNGSFSCQAQKICKSSGKMVLKNRRFVPCSFSVAVT